MRRADLGHVIARAHCALLGLCLAAAATTAQAQGTYPNRPIRMVVPFPAGESVDVIGRTLAERCAAMLGQQVVVDNRAGAGGQIGTELVARAAPDGYTVLMGNIGGLAIIPALSKKVPYNVTRDFVAVSQTANVPFFLFVSAAVPLKTFADVVDYAKKHPKKLNYASTGIGSGVHLAGELFANVAGIELTHVPYKGVGLALPEIISGNVQIVFYPVTFLPQVKEGKLRPVAITAAQRSPALPEVPTTAELGMPKMVASSWHAMVAPAGTPGTHVNRLYQTLKAALGEPAVRSRMTSLGVEPVGSSPEQAARFLAEEIDKWRTTGQAAGVRLD